MIEKLDKFLAMNQKDKASTNQTKDALIYLERRVISNPNLVEWNLWYLGRKGPWRGKWRSFQYQKDPLCLMYKGFRQVRRQARSVQTMGRFPLQIAWPWKGRWLGVLDLCGQNALPQRLSQWRLESWTSQQNLQLKRLKVMD